MKPALYLLPWLGLTALTGCSWEEDPATCLPETTSLQVTVSARQEGDLNSRADENAKPGEFMNDLCVLFVQNNVVKLKLQPDLSNDASATAGNLENWTSGEQFLEAGPYTVYAFANISDYYGKWSEGGTLSGDALPESIVIEDPAGNLDFKNGKFIPMSAKEEITITAATRSVSIGLDRLVSKVRMTVSTTSQEPVTVKNVTFSGYADKVSLIKDASLSSVNRDRSYAYTHDVQISHGNPEDIPEFYVNETRQGEDPFSISVTTDENQGVTYLATTTRTDLPRNSIYPLELNLKESGLELKPTAYIQGTGLPPYDIDYEVDYTTGTYILGITYGSYLSIIPTIKDAKNTPQFTWAMASNNPTGISICDKTEAEKAGLPTLPEGGILYKFSADEMMYNNNYTITLNAVWADNNDRHYNRTYNVIVRISQDYNTVLDKIIDNLSLMSSRRHGSIITLTPERLQMYKTRQR